MQGRGLRCRGGTECGGGTEVQKGLGCRGRTEIGGKTQLQGWNSGAGVQGWDLGPNVQYAHPVLLFCQSCYSEPCISVAVKCCGLR